MAKVNKLVKDKVVKSDANSLTAAVLTLFNAHGFELFRVNVTVPKIKGQYVRSVPNGTPDIIGYSPKGHFVAIEIKVGRDKLRPEQKVFIDKVSMTPDGRAVVIHNLNEALEFLKTFGPND